MACAPIGLPFEKVEGEFIHRETKVRFEWTVGAPCQWAAERSATHTIFVTDGTRPARVLKTVAYIGVDEEDDQIVWEKWPIKTLWSRTRESVAEDFKRYQY
jgi:hypothetical protein